MEPFGVIAWQRALGSSLHHIELKMMKKPVTTNAPAEQVAKDIRRAMRKLHSSEEKIRIGLVAVWSCRGLVSLL